MNKDFFKMSREALTEFIFEKKAELGDEVCILEHNFQIDDLLKFADIVGDTSSLLKMTMETDADYLLYAGAKFFTEAGCILCPDKRIMQANLKADCPLTYTIDENETERVFNDISKKNKKELVPVCYFTASYKLKSFSGRNDGTTCTAANAYDIILYYLNQGKSIFFTPMSNIAFNVVKELQLEDKDVALIDEKTDINSITGEEKIYIWDVGCYVHSNFKTQDVEKLRKKYKNMKFISHLECLPDVIEKCEFASFTNGITDILRNNPNQDEWGFATVSNFAERLAKQYPNKTILPVRPDLVCEDMILTDLPHLADSLQSIVDYKNGKGELRTELKVPEEHRIYALKAINKMYSILAGLENVSTI
ncbi:quinolinate synthase NadA [Clostridiaceae bacterium M8S5]|nr:quinolinate synthase NadA [Clostridiaceae bacterium M8S5]